MKSMRLRICAVTIVLFLCVIALSAGVISCEANEPDVSAKDVNSADIKPKAAKPMIIWFHSSAANSLESLETALSSGLITHVIVKYMHRADTGSQIKPAVRKAIDIVKKSPAKLIWCRSLWPYYANENIRQIDIFDPNYYIREIKILRQESNKIGADFVAIDTEAYAYSPMKYYLDSTKRKKLTPEQHRELSFAITTAVAIVGKVDFIFPAGSLDPKHPYNILAGLGENRIAENTYYANEKTIRSIKYPYEIFGVYVNTVRENTDYPNSPHFLVSDVFENSDLWSAKKGIFIYMQGPKAETIAEELFNYSRTLPVKQVD